MKGSRLAAAVCAALLTVPFPGAAGAAPRDTGGSVAGTLNVLQEDDFVHGRSLRRYFVERDSAGRVEIRFRDTPRRSLTTGDRVTLREGRGTWLSARVVELQSDADLAVVTSPAAVTGTRRAIVTVVDFADASVGCSDAAIADLMYDGIRSVDGLYRASSYGALGFRRDTDQDGAADVFRVMIPASVEGTCDAHAWADAADQALPPQVELGDYQHRVYVLPSGTTCSWAGLGSVGCGGGCRTWVTTCNLADVYAHELGHNLGMGHASTDTDNDGLIDSEYGDRSDFMGIGGVGYRGTAGPHTHQLGWFSGPQEIDLSGGGTQTRVVSPLHLDPGVAPYPQVLRVARSQGDGHYYISYRRAEGYDAQLPAGYAGRTSLHVYSGSGSSQSRLVAVLADGEGFDDPQTGLSVSQLSHDALSATLQVTLGETCVQASPRLEVAAPLSVARPGASLHWSVTVSNDDDAACDPTTFDLSASAPGGWSVGFDAGSVTLDPGQSAVIGLGGAVPAGATDGPASIDLVLADSGDAGHAASLGLQVRVDGTPPHPVPRLGASLGIGGGVWLGWSAVADPSGEPVSYRVERAGVPIGTSETRSFLDDGGSPGAVYRVIAIDAAGNEAPPSPAATPARRGRRAPAGGDRSQG